MHNFWGQNVWTFPSYIVLTTRINTFWPKGFDKFWSEGIVTFWAKRKIREEKLVQFIQVSELSQVFMYSSLFQNVSIPPLPNICQRYPTMIKLGSYTYQKKIQKIYKSCDTTLEFCWYHHFFTGNQQMLLYQKILI